MQDTKEFRDEVPRGLVDKMLWSGERNVTRLIVALVFALLLITGWAVAETVLRHVEHREWLDFMSGYDFESYDYAQDGEGVNIIGSGNEAINYGTALANTPNDP